MEKYEITLILYLKKFHFYFKKINNLLLLFINKDKSKIFKLFRGIKVFYSFSRLI
jgi:hypothetical protein